MNIDEQIEYMQIKVNEYAKDVYDYPGMFDHELAMNMEILSTLKEVKKDIELNKQINDFVKGCE